MSETTWFREPSVGNREQAIRSCLCALDDLVGESLGALDRELARQGVPEHQRRDSLARLERTILSRWAEFYLRPRDWRDVPPLALSNALIERYLRERFGAAR